MPSLEEFISQKREVEERKLALEKYRLELARIQGNINAAIYHANSTQITDYDIQYIKVLETQKKSITAELKRDCRITPHRIPEQIKECNHQILMINRQLYGIEQQGQQQSDYVDLYDTAKEQAAPLHLQEQSQDDRDR